jgi:hypothetical protein
MMEVYLFGRAVGLLLSVLGFRPGMFVAFATNKSDTPRAVAVKAPGFGDRRSKSKRESGRRPGSRFFNQNMPAVTSGGMCSM